MNVVTGTFPPKIIPERAITKLAFRNRFTTAEKVAIAMAAIDNPSRPMEERLLAASIRSTLDDQRDAEYIDLDRPDLIAGTEKMEQYNLISTGRSGEIIFGEIHDIERFTG